MTKKIFIITLTITSFLLILALVLGTIFDLTISKALCVLKNGEYYSSNFFIAFFEIFGETILYVLLVGCFSILFNYFYKKNMTKKILKTFILAVCVIFCFASVLLFFYKTLEYSFDHMPENFKVFMTHIQTKIFIVLLSTIIEFFCLHLFNKLSFDSLKNLTKWAIIVLVILAFSNGLVQLLKHVFHRTRYRAMLYVGDTEFSYYTNWFQVNHKTFNSLVEFGSDFFKSFPSGHACAVSSIFCLCLLPLFLEKLNTRKWKNIFLSLSIVLTIVVLLSRIMAGAHFLTDVLIGSLITIIPILIVYITYNKWLNQMLSKI